MALPSSSVIKGLNLPRDPETRKEVYGAIVKEYIRQSPGRKLRIMVVGEVGQGKSTLINALVGTKIAQEGAEFKAGMTVTQRYKVTQYGVHMEIWDTPGLGVGDEEEDQKIIESLQNIDCHSLDLVLFCVRMDITRIPTRVHIDTIKKLTEIFGGKFWKHCVFVLTFANHVEHLCPANEDLGIFFSNRLEAIEDKLRQALSEHAHLSDKEIAYVRAVPVGSAKESHDKNPWALPDREDWFLEFWMDIADQMYSPALSNLLQANYHRIHVPSGDTGVSASLFPPPDVEPHLRMLEATEEERLQLRDRMKNDFIVIQEPDDERTPENKPTEGSNDDGSTVQAHEKGAEPIPIHNRLITWREMQIKQLEEENSSFFTYMSKFAEVRGKETKVIGHVRGFIEGAMVYLSRGRERENPVHQSFNREGAGNETTVGVVDLYNMPVSDHQLEKQEEEDGKREVKVHLEKTVAKQKVIASMSSQESQESQSDSRQSFRDQELRRQSVDSGNVFSSVFNSSEYVYKVVSGVRERVINWQDKDIISIIVPAGFIPPDCTCDITIRPVSSKNCTFPEDTVLVSEIFEVYASCDILEPITIKLQHCVEFSEDMTASLLTFTKAESLKESSSLLHHFEEHEGGVFTVGSQYGHLKCKKFSLFSLNLRRKLGLPYTLRCSVQLLYYCFSKQGSISKHKAFILVTKNIPNLIEHAIQNVEKKCDVEVIVQSTLSISRVILTVQSEEISTDGSWKIIPLQTPCEIEKTFIEDYNESQCVPPMLSYSLQPLPAHSSDEIRHVFQFVGTRDGSCSLTFLHNIGTAVTPTSTITDLKSSIDLPTPNGSFESHPDDDLEKMRQFIKKKSFVLDYSKLNSAVKHSLQKLAENLFEKEIIDHNLVQEPDYLKIIDAVSSYFDWSQSREDLEKNYGKFIVALYDTGGPAREAARKLSSELKKELKENYDIDFEIPDELC